LNASRSSALERAGLREHRGEVQRRLSAHGRQQRVGLLARDHRFEVLARERLDVRAVGDPRVGHDGRGIRVDEHGLESLGAQRLDRLRAGIVELARLADHDRPRAGHEDAPQILPARHQRPP